MLVQDKVLLYAGTQKLQVMPLPPNILELDWKEAKQLYGELCTLSRSRTKWQGIACQRLISLSLIMSSPSILSLSLCNVFVSQLQYYCYFTLERGKVMITVCRALYNMGAEVTQAYRMQWW